MDQYEEGQKIDLSKIVCDICKINNKGNTHNNIFYICNTCNKNMCPICKSSHDNNHSIINYDDKNYICKNIMIHLLNFAKHVIVIFVFFVKKSIITIKYLILKRY